MKVLFVSSGNSVYGISPIIKNQAESLSRKIEIDFFTIGKKGVFGYLKTIPILKKHLKNGNYDVIHAHYSSSAYVASLAGSKPLVVSLMGSDVMGKPYYKYIIKLFHALFWSNMIVKSKLMKDKVGYKKAEIISNGVNMDKFSPIKKEDALAKLNWDTSKKYILFAANPSRYVKNFDLAKRSFDLLNIEGYELKVLENIPNDKMPYVYNASEVVLLTSLWEGSPNVIKEAMACNIPIVSTDVGDVKNVIGRTEGCYITNYDEDDVKSKIRKALEYSKRTNGRNNIKHLSDKKIADRIVEIYNKAIKAK